MYEHVKILILVIDSSEPVCGGRGRYCVLQCSHYYCQVDFLVRGENWSVSCMKEIGSVLQRCMFMELNS